MTQILGFITESFCEGFQFNTTAGFRSAVSVYHNPIGSIAVGWNSRVLGFLPVLFNNRPPQPKYTFIWDVKRIIKFLTTLPYDSDLSLKDLTLKLTVLLALTSAGWASEISYLQMR